MPDFLNLELHGPRLLFEVVLTLAAAVLLALLMQRLRQSAVLGFMLAGFLLGPGVLGVVHSVEEFHVMGELGVALLLFAIGLELSWNRLRHDRRLTFMTGVLQLAVTVVVTALLATVVGLDWRASIVLGMVASLSSTAVVLRVLADRAEIDSSHGLVALGVLLVQDVAVVLFLLFVPQLEGFEGAVPLLQDLAVAIGKLAVLLVTMYLIERVAFRRLFHHMASGSERELLAVLAITVSLGAAGLTQAMGLSAALGAFVAGLLIGDAPYGDQVRADIAPVRTGLVLLFFAFVGLLADPIWILEHLALVLAAGAALILGKFAITFAAARVTRVPVRVAFLAAASVAQLGEFSFVIATEAMGYDLLDEDAFQAIVSVTLLTLLATPFCISVASRLAHRGVEIPGRDPGRVGASERAVDQGEEQRTDHVVVVGHGPAGEGVSDALHWAGIFTVIVELNPRLHPAQHDNMRVVQGDAGRLEVLKAADAHHARAVVVTVPEPLGLSRIIAQVRALNPEVPIIARGRYHRFVEQVSAAGATVVVDEESETGQRLAEETLGLLRRADRASE